MKSTINLAFLVFILLSLSSRVSAAAVKPVLPSDDTFYDAPVGYEDKEEGSILKWRKTPFQLETIFLPIHLKNSWQFLVRSTDSHGNPNAIVTTLMEPYNADSSKLVSYQTAEDSSSPNCAPSYAFLHRSSLKTAMTKAEMFFIETMLEQGYYVVSPDYEGPKATFSAGRQSGHATLDSIRAILKTSDITRIDSKPQIIMWGYSGGTIASGWAAALQPTYAPELKPLLLGAALGGWVTNLTAVIEAVDGTLFAGFAASGVLGLMKEYPSLIRVFVENLHPSKYPRALKLIGTCAFESITKFAFQNFFSGSNKYSATGWDALSDPVAKKVLDENTLALNNKSEKPEIPLFVFHGELDHIIPFKDSQRVYEKFCDWGIDSFEFAVDETAGHISEFVVGAPAAIAWINGRFNGTKPVEGCQRTKRFTNLEYPGASKGVADVIGDAIKSVFGENIGPNGENITLSQVEKLFSRL